MDKTLKYNNGCCIMGLTLAPCAVCVYFSYTYICTYAHQIAEHVRRELEGKISSLDKAWCLVRERLPEHGNVLCLTHTQSWLQS